MSTLILALFILFLLYTSDALSYAPVIAVLSAFFLLPLWLQGIF
jgi:hypothetical protein